MKNYLLMKKLSLLLLVLITNQLYSQKIDFGMHAGLAATAIYDFADGLDDDFEPKPSITLGARCNIKLGPVGFCSELNYISKQYSRIGETLPNGQFFEFMYPTDFTQNYISIPVLLKLYAGPLNLHFGVQAASLIGGFTEDQELGSTFYDDPQYYYIVGGQEYWQWEDIDVAGVFGFGLDLNKLYISYRATVSISPVTNIDWIDAMNEEYNAIGIPNFYDSQFMDELGRLVTNEITIGFNF